MNRSSVCIDASLLIKLLVDEDLSEQADHLRQAWAAAGVERCAPSLIDYEIVSALGQKVRRGTLSADLAGQLLALALEEQLVNIDSNDLHKSAQRLAIRLDIPSTYDAHYLAVAEELDCEFWTADERLYNTIRGRFPLIRWVGEASGGAQPRPEDQPDEGGQR